MGIVRDRMSADLKIANYRFGTREAYLRFARQFVEFHGRGPEEMGAAEIRTFLEHLVDRGLSVETIRGTRASLKFLYAVTLNRPVEVDWIPVPRKPKRTAVVLSGSQVVALLDTTRRLKYRTMFASMYGAGLRVSEACGVRVEDIDSRRMLLKVRGKGGKERYTMLSQRLLELLRKYWQEARPGMGYLFPGGRDGVSTDRRSASRAFRQAATAAGLGAKVTTHSLRRSFATHLIELGTDVTVVKTLLGHCSLKTTQLYTLTREAVLMRTRSPLDVLGTPAGEILG